MRWKPCLRQSVQLAAVTTAGRAVATSVGRRQVIPPTASHAISAGDADCRTVEISVVGVLKHETKLA